MASIEWYAQHAEELAKEVMDRWEVKTEADNPAPLTNDFKALVDKASQYRVAKSNAERRRQFTDLNAMDAKEEEATRQAFAEAYKNYSEKKRE